MDTEEQLKGLAENVYSLAAYYLGKYYYSEQHDIKKSIYWLLRSTFGACNHAAYLLGRLQDKYPRKVLEVQKKLQKEYY